MQEFDVTELDYVLMTTMSKVAEDAGETAATASVGWSYEVNSDGTGGKLRVYKRVRPPVST